MAASGPEPRAAARHFWGISVTRLWDGNRLQVHLVMETKCWLEQVRAATFILPNQTSAHQMLPGARHLTRMSEAGQAGPAAKSRVYASSKGPVLLGPVGPVLPDLPVLCREVRSLNSYKIFGYNVFAIS